jgi:hypothetical protein
VPVQVDDENTNFIPMMKAAFEHANDNHAKVKWSIIQTLVESRDGERLFYPEGPIKATKGQTSLISGKSKQFRADSNAVNQTSYLRTMQALHCDPLRNH